MHESLLFMEVSWAWCEWSDECLQGRRSLDDHEVGPAGMVLQSFPQKHSYERMLVSGEVKVNLTLRCLHFCFPKILNFQVNLSGLTLYLPCRRSSTLFPQEQCVFEKSPMCTVHFRDKSHCIFTGKMLLFLKHTGI